MTKNTTTNYNTTAANRDTTLADTGLDHALTASASTLSDEQDLNKIATVKTSMGSHLQDWLAGLQQANDVLPAALRFAETHLQVSSQNSGAISLPLIEQLEALPVFALTVVLQKQALAAKLDSDSNSNSDSSNNDSDSTQAAAFAAHIENWAQQNDHWQMISVPHSARQADAAQTLAESAQDPTITPVITYNYILLPTEAVNMQAGKKAAAAHLIDDSMTAHLHQFIASLPISIDMGGDDTIDCHIVPLAKVLRPHRVICFDMDSTLIEQEVINELANKAGIGEQVSKITEAAMRGEIDFDTSFSQRVGLLQGLSTTVLDDIQHTLTLSAGARPLIRKLKAIGYHTVLVSGGFTYFADRIAQTLGIDEVHANILDIDSATGTVTGQVNLPIVNGERKAVLVQKIAKRFNISPAQVVCVGDGANDLAMMAVADIGIAYHAKPIVRARADAAINATGLEGVLYVLGYLPEALLSHG